jgi:hypothetical protein
MKNIAVSVTKNESVLKNQNGGLLRNYVLNPIKSGLFGFAAFFTILLVTKLFSYWIGTYSELVVDIDDVLLSIIGFILVFLIKFLENFKQADN